MAKAPTEKEIADGDQLTLDRVLSKAPSFIQESDLDDLVVALRNQRTRFIAADAKKAERKEGIEDNETDAGDGDELLAE